MTQLGANPQEMTVTFAAGSMATATARAEGVVNISSTDRNLLGRRSWRVDIEKDGRTSQRYITGTVRLSRAAVIAKRAISPGATLAEEDVECVMREDDGRQDRMISLAAVVGQQVRRPLVVGQVIAAGDLKSPILVVRGQTVWVAAGPVKVRANALANGAAGETVEFENAQSKRHFSAKVTAPGAAEVALNP